MIRITVLTEIEFRERQDFLKFLESEDVARITGFAEEMRLAEKTRGIVIAKTLRPSIGAVTKSEITVEELFELAGPNR